MTKLIKKILFTFIVFTIAIFSADSFGKDLELKIKEFKCTKEGVHVTYSIVNEKNFTRPNVGVGFKVEIDNKIAAFKEVTVNVPKDKKGEHTMELVIPAPCDGKPFKLITAVFPSGTSRYKVKNWFTECP